MSFRSFFAPREQSQTAVSFLISGVLFLFIVSFLAVPFIDSDLGWHLRAGQQILERGEIPTVDWFSYTAPDFPWIDHEAFTDVGLFLLHDAIGLVGLQILFAFLGLLLFGLIVPLALGSSTPYPLRVLIGAVFAVTVWQLAGVRPQVLTWLFAGILLLFLQSARLPNRKHLVWYIPPLVLLWVNLHGGFFTAFFILGAVVLGETIVAFAGGSQSLFPRDTLRPLWAATGLSFAATFINPYGYRIYTELWRTATDQFGRSFISEWQPSTVTHLSGGLFIAGILLFLLWWGTRRGRIKPTHLFLVYGFAVLSFLAVRNVPLFLLAIIPFLSDALKRINRNDANRITHSPAGATAIILLAVAGLLWAPLVRPNTDTFAIEPLEWNERQGYPVTALEWLQQRAPAEERLFSVYAWGGYLLWKWPERKTFIDGRMLHWRNGAVYPFHDFITIIKTKEGWQDRLDENNVKWILFRSDDQFSEVLRFHPAWNEVYQDDVAIIFQRATLGSPIKAADASFAL